MARRKVKRKSNVRDQQSLQLVGTNRKRRQRGDKRESEQSQVRCKRRKTQNYNLRQSNSVILVGETPCCQTTEQQEKYTKLGLNSALFLKGSQRPKRKQSHISIITISSDDEETSEERTSEWINSLVDNQQFSEEPEILSVSEDCLNVASTSDDQRNHRSFLCNPGRQDQGFEPLCSSTPNTSTHVQPLTQSQPEAKGSAFKCTDSASGHQLEKWESAQGSTSTSKEPSSRYEPENCDFAQESDFPFKEPSSRQKPEKFESPRESAFTFKESPTENQPERCELAKGSGHPTFHQGAGSSSRFGSSSCSPSMFPKHPLNTESSGLENSKPDEERTAKLPIFFFGSSTPSKNVNIGSVNPFKPQFNNLVDISTSSGGFTLPREPNLNSHQGICCEQNIFHTGDTNNNKNTNNPTEPNSENSDPSERF